MGQTNKKEKILRGNNVIIIWNIQNIEYVNQPYTKYSYFEIALLSSITHY